MPREGMLETDQIHQMLPASRMDCEQKGFSMTDPSPSPSQQPPLDAGAASEQVRDALQVLVDIMGPRTCDHEADWADCDEPGCLYEHTRPMSGTMMLGEFVIVCEWTDMVHGGEYTMCFEPKGQRRPHTKGLLWTGLEEF